MGSGRGCDAGGALAAHDEVLRTAIEAHGGFLFKSHRRRCVSPRSPRRDLRLLRLSLPRGRWSCRCGWGWRPGRPNCATVTTSVTVLNRAARVMAAGHGGQVLVADSTASLLSGVDLAGSGATSATRPANPGRCVSGACARPAAGISAAAGARLESGKFASGDHELDRPRMPTLPRSKRQSARIGW